MNQEQEDLFEGSSETILDQELPADFASRVPRVEPELRGRLFLFIPNQPELNANAFNFGHTLGDNPRLNPTATSLPLSQSAPPSNLTAAPQGPNISKPAFEHRSLPIPVPTGRQRYVPFTAETEPAPRPSPHLLVPYPHTVPWNPRRRPHPYPSNIVPEPCQNVGLYRTHNRTPPPATQAVPQYTYANTQTPPTQASGATPGSISRPLYHPVHQVTTRYASMPTFQNTAQSPSRSDRRRTFQSIPMTNNVRNQAPHFRNTSQPPYGNGSPPVHNAPLPFQNDQPLYQNDPPVQNAPFPFQNGSPYVQNGYVQNGYVQNGLFYFQNGYVHNGLPYFQNGYFRNGQPYFQNGNLQNDPPSPNFESGYFQNGQLYFQNQPPPIPNYSLPFNNSQRGRSPTPAPRPPSPRGRSPPPAPRFLHREPIAPRSPVPQVPPLPASHSVEESFFEESFVEESSVEESSVEESFVEEKPSHLLAPKSPVPQVTPLATPRFVGGSFVEESSGEESSVEEKPSHLFSPPVGIMRHLYWAWIPANTLGP